MNIKNYRSYVLIPSGWYCYSQWERYDPDRPCVNRDPKHTEY